jgi:hypothetical protein
MPDETERGITSEKGASHKRKEAAVFQQLTRRLLKVIPVPIVIRVQLPLAPLGERGGG